MSDLIEITIDFETYYSKKEKYSLSSKDMTPEQYIRNPKFEIIGLAIKVQDKQSQFLTTNEIQEWLDHIEIVYGWDNVRLIAHNARFDCAILGWVFNVYPKQIADTMLMSRAIRRWDFHSLDNLTKQLRSQHNWAMWYVDGVAQCGVLDNPDSFYTEDKGEEVHNADGKHLMDFTDEEYSAYAYYAMKDVDLTWSAYKWFMNVWEYPQKEIEVMTYTIEMFTYPVMELDQKVLLEVQKEIHHKRDCSLEKTGLSLSDVRSDQKFAEALQSLGVQPPTKQNAKGETKYAFAKTDVAFQKLLEHENEDVVNLVNARLNNKSSQVVTRVQSFIDMSSRGPLPIPLEYYAAHTGRWGGCLVADTMVLCLMPEHTVVQKRIVDVLFSDLVWDGVEFVEHEGVKFSGYQEVITYDGITGTKCHPVFINDRETISLFEAMRTETPIFDCPAPNNFSITGTLKNGVAPPKLVPVYDIVNCGPRHRFWANGKLVHNSDRLNPQNLNRNVLVNESTKTGMLVFYKGKADRFVSLLPDGKVFLAKHGAVENSEVDLHVVGLRDAFKAPKGKVLVVLDLSQIELRMNAYLAGEQWVLDTLMAGKDIYKAAAAKSFGISYEEVTKTQRYVGKQQELLLGYGGGENAIVRGIGKKAEDYSSAELKSWVTLYRSSHPNIVKQWKRFTTVIHAMAQGVATEVDPKGILHVDGDSILLPNGMRIVYRGIKVERGVNGYNEVYFWGKNKITGRPDWEKTFGGKIDENCVQALSRIILSDAMAAMREAFSKRGWGREQAHLVMQVHDEVITCCDEGIAEEVYSIMEDCLTRVPTWADGLPLACDGDIARRYGCAK